MIDHVGTADKGEYISGSAPARSAARPMLGITLNHIAYFLTKRCFSKKLPRMDGDVTKLERKLDEFLSRFHRLREENRSLHERVQSLEGENGALTDRMQAARVRLEALMGQLPEQ